MLRRVDENIPYILIRRAGLLWNGGHLSLASARLSCTPYNDDTADTLHLVCLLREGGNCSLVRFFCSPTSSSLLRIHVKNDMWQKAKNPVNTRPLPLRQHYILEQEEARRGFWQVSMTAEAEDECTCVHTCGRHCICHTNTPTSRLERTDSSPTVARTHTREQMPCSYHQTQSNAPHSWLAIAWFLFPLKGS